MMLNVGTGGVRQSRCWSRVRRGGHTISASVDVVDGDEVVVCCSTLVPVVSDRVGAGVGFGDEVTVSASVVVVVGDEVVV